MNNPTNNTIIRFKMLPKAIARMVAGPPMSERGRYTQAVAEARTSTYEGLASTWCRPR